LGFGFLSFQRSALERFFGRSAACARQEKPILANDLAIVDRLSRRGCQPYINGWPHRAILRAAPKSHAEKPILSAIFH